MRAEASGQSKKPHHHRTHDAGGEGVLRGQQGLVHPSCKCLFFYAGPTMPMSYKSLRSPHDGLCSLEGALTPVTTSSPPLSMVILAAPIAQVGKLRISEASVSLRAYMEGAETWPRSVVAS